MVVVAEHGQHGDGYVGDLAGEHRRLGRIAAPRQVAGNQQDIGLAADRLELRAQPSF